MPRKMEPKRLCYLKSRVFDPSFLYEFLALGKPELSTVKFPPGSPYHYVTKNFEALSNSGDFFGYPRFLETSSGRSYHNLVVASKIVVSKSDLWYRSLFSFNYHQQRKMTNSFKTIFWFTIPTFSNVALQKKESSAPPGDLSSSPSIDTLQALRLEMTEDYYYDLARSSYVQWEAGGSHFDLGGWRLEPPKRNVVCLGVSTNIKDEAEIWWGKTNNKHHQEWGYTDIPSGPLSWLENLSIV